MRSPPETFSALFGAVVLDVLSVESILFSQKRNITGKGCVEVWLGAGQCPAEHTLFLSQYEFDCLSPAG